MEAARPVRIRRDGLRPLLALLVVVAIPAGIFGWFARGSAGALDSLAFCDALYAEARSAADTAAVDRTIAHITVKGARTYCVEHRLRP
jgi:hypothetical protein